MTTIRKLGFALVLGLLAPFGCGGGGGGGDGEGFAFSDIVGSWQGPTGNVTVDGELFLAAGPTGLAIDASGTATGIGASSLEGTVSLASSSLGTFKFAGTGTFVGLDGLLIMSPDKNHVLWATDGLLFGAWERDATDFAPPYTDADLWNETWTGLACEVTAVMNPVDAESIAVVIDGAGNFTADTSSTNAAPLNVADTIKGAYLGDAIDPGPPVETSNVVVLMTPDRQFVAIFSCLVGGTFPDDCSYAALSR